jgi:porin
VAVQAQEPLTVQDWLKRAELFGDWGGARTRMAEHGLKIDASFTQFFAWAPRQSPIGDERGFDYGGKVDVNVTHDLGKVAPTWAGVSASAHLEFRYGETTLLAGGTLLPTNTALLFPENEGEAIKISSLHVSKLFGTSTLLQAGRFNTVDLYVKPFTGGRGLDGFMNVAFVAPPLVARTTPAVVEGVFVTALKDFEPLVTVGLYESTEDGFFRNGATVYGAVTLPIKLFVTPGHYVVTATASSIVATSLDQTPFALLPIFDVPLESESNAWTLDFTFDQYVMWDAATRQGWGVFGSIGVSDSDPSFVDLFAHLGVGGTSPFRGRGQDNFGAGYYFNGVSDVLRETLSPFVRLRNESGFELFYNYAIAGWSKVTADLQIVDPFAVGSKTRSFFSVRWKLTF